LLEYVLPQNGSAYCLVLSAKGASIVQLRSAAEIATLAQTVYSADVNRHSGDVNNHRSEATLTI